MKKIGLLLAATLLVFSHIDAQDAKKMLKNATKDASKAITPTGIDQGKMRDALYELDAALKDPVVGAASDSWNEKGKVYNSIAESEMKAKVLDDTYTFAYPEAGVIAFDAFKKALELATKSGQTKDALTGLAETENHLNNMGITYFQENNYKDAFYKFSKSFEVYEVLSANKKPSRLDDEATRMEHLFYTGATGFYGKAGKEALPYLEILYKANYENALVYQALFEIKGEMGDQNAIRFLEEGRQKFPGETGLLFSEINYYLKKNQLDVLIGKLKQAIEAEPNNISVYATLGNVFDQLMQQERNAGNMDKSKEYFESALDYYNQALKIDANNFDVNYSLGALYYNKAASLIGELNKLSDDYSKEGTRKYKALQKDMDELFDQAMPYFKKAEGINPKDFNTLVALREIYARKGDVVTSNEYKERIDALQKAN